MIQNENPNSHFASLDSYETFCPISSQTDPLKIMSTHLIANSCDGMNDLSLFGGGPGGGIKASYLEAI